MGTTIVRHITHSSEQVALSHKTDSDDIKNVDLTKIHNLSGPVAVEGAEPGDCLVIDILDGVYTGFLHEILSNDTDSQFDHLRRCLGDIPYVPWRSGLPCSNR